MVNKDEISFNDINDYLDEESIIKNEDVIDKKYENYKLNAAREEFEKNFIEKKLKENNFNISKTAKALGLYPSNLHSKINKLDISIEKLKNNKI
jgi:two-component system nitrogen regulation response regulator NtrX